MPSGRVDTSDPTNGPLGGIPANRARMNADASGKMLQEQLFKDKSTGLKVP
jgi:hypothetical protein